MIQKVNILLFMIIHLNNLQVYQEQKLLKMYVDAMENVQLMDIICFEYILLEFNKLIQWIYAPNDEFLVKRAVMVEARNKLVAALQSDNVDYKTIQEIIDYDSNLSNHNIEQLTAKLLFDLTRNTGFEVAKGTIGNCWIESCCNWNDRQENDVCGLELSRLSVRDKMKDIYMGTSLNKEFLKVGLEVSL